MVRCGWVIVGVGCGCRHRSKAGDLVRMGVVTSSMERDRMLDGQLTGSDERWGWSSALDADATAVLQQVAEPFRLRWRVASLPSADLPLDVLRGPLAPVL